MNSSKHIDRARNQRLLKQALEYLENAKTPGAKAAAAMSVRMLEEMLGKEHR